MIAPLRLRALMCVFSERGREKSRGKERRKRAENKNLNKALICFFLEPGCSNLVDCPKSVYSLAQEQPAHWRKVISKPRFPASKTATLHSAFCKPQALFGCGARCSASTKQHPFTQGSSLPRGQIDSLEVDQMLLFK